MRLSQTEPQQSINERVAAELRAEIARQGMTRAAFSGRIGWSQQRLSLRLTGRVALTIPELEEFAAALGVPVTQFLPAPARAA